MRKKVSIFFFSVLISILLVPAGLAWELDRPKDDVEFFEERLESLYTDGKASVGLGVDVYKYYEDDPGWLAEGNDCVKLNVIATGNSREIITYSSSYLTNYDWHEVNEEIEISLEDDYNSICLIDEDDYPVRFYGSRGSAEYKTIYISENGFITFDFPVGPCKYYSGTIPCARARKTWMWSLRSHWCKTIL